MSNPTTLSANFDGSLAYTAVSGAGSFSGSGPERYDGGLWLEEGTTNFVTNPSMETNISGWTGVGPPSSLTRVADSLGDGSYAGELVTTASPVGQQCYCASSGPYGSGAQSFTFSASLWGSGVTNLLANCWVNGYTVQRKTLSSDVTLGGTPTRVSVSAETQPGDTINYVGGNIGNLVHATNVTTVRFDAVQAEAKAYATSYTPSTRAASSASVPTAGIISPNSGSLAFRFTRKIDTGDIEYILNCGTDGDDRLRIYIDTDDRLRVAWDTGGALPQSVVSSSTIAVGTEYLVYTEWDGINIAMSLDAGTLVTGIRDVPLGSWGTDDLVLGP